MICPSRLRCAHEILNAKPYAFLDNATLEERRTQAVYLRRATDPSATGLGILDPQAIEKVRAEAWPVATNADELHEALLQIGVMTEVEVRKTTGGSTEWLDVLVEERRVAGLPDRFWSAAGKAGNACRDLRRFGAVCARACSR